MTDPKDWPPEAREALKDALEPLFWDSHDGPGTDTVSDAALAALAPFVEAREFEARRAAWEHADKLSAQLHALQAEVEAIKAAAFKRGAEAMRAKADADVASWPAHDTMRAMARKNIRALPIPEDKP